MVAEVSLYSNARYSLDESYTIENIQKVLNLWDHVLMYVLHSIRYSLGLDVVDPQTIPRTILFHSLDSETLLIKHFFILLCEKKKGFFQVRFACYHWHNDMYNISVRLDYAVYIALQSSSIAA